MLSGPEDGDEDGGNDEGGVPLQLENSNPGQPQATNGNGGLLGASTLAALQGFTTGPSGGKKEADKPAGPLVGYGSDSDED